MRTSLADLPLQEFAFLNPLVDAEMGAYPLSCGICEERGRRRYDFDNSERREGGRRFALLQCTLAGEGRFATVGDGQTRALGPGQAFLVTAPGPTRYWLPPQRTWFFAYLLYAGEMAMWQTERVLERAGPVLTIAPDGPVAEALMALILMGETADGHRAAAGLHRLLMELRRQAEAPSDGALPEAVARAIRLIERHYADPGFGVEALAKECGYSRFHFSRLFRRHVGQSPQDCLTATRLRQAMARLSHDAAPVKAIAAACGFNDCSYFCRLFSRRYGVNPGALRR